MAGSSWRLIFMAVLAGLLNLLLIENDIFARRVTSCSHRLKNPPNGGPIHSLKSAPSYATDTKIIRNAENFPDCAKMCRLPAIRRKILAGSMSNQQFGESTRLSVEKYPLQAMSSTDVSTFALSRWKLTTSRHRINKSRGSEERHCRFSSRYLATTWSRTEGSTSSCIRRTWASKIVRNCFSVGLSRRIR